MWDRFGGPGPVWDAPGWQGLFVGLIPMLLFALALGALLVWAVLRMSRLSLSPPAPPPAGLLRDPALEQARMRYARGEMPREEYLRVATDLGEQGPTKEEAI